MEKFSSFRDPGTGIQPFLPPVPPSGATSFDTALLPISAVVGTIRALLILTFTVVCLILTKIVCLPLIFIPPLYRAITYSLIAIFIRLIFLVLGFWWIPVEIVSKKRRQHSKSAEAWRPRAGDLIISNWVSWIEILWLAFRFNPTFVLPIATAPATNQAPSPAASTGRKTGTGSAAISSALPLTPQMSAPIRGFREVSLLQMLHATGHTPPFGHQLEGCASLEEIRKRSLGPVVVFPECTTSNGRGLLRFAEVFGPSSLPIRKYQVFLMCVRYDPPTETSPTLTLAVPTSSTFLPNPLWHLVSLAYSLSLSRTLSIRLLEPSESPSSGTFIVSDVLEGGQYSDQLAEASAVLIAQLGKMKRTMQGWEEKVAFLNFYQAKTGK